MPTLVTHDTGWEYSLGRCPADAHFLDWIKDQQQLTVFPGMSVLHMGPGMHHIVGTTLALQSIYTLSITCSPPEYLAYIEWAKHNPQYTRNYQCMFMDIHMINAFLVPKFDIFTLFHLGEMPDNTRIEYGSVPSQQVLNTLIHWNSKPGARILTYIGSNAPEPSPTTMMDKWAVSEREYYKSLVVYTL